jgi:DUF4097 and DUF4098 domain-containing protein YvlB
MRKPAPIFVQMTALTAAALALAACDISIGASEYSVREEKTFTVSGPARLALTTFDGNIEVRGWDRSEVLVEVEKRGPDQATVEKIQVKAVQDGNAITIDVPKPSPLVTTGFRSTPSASLIVSVPTQTAVSARSGDGAVTIRRVNGNIDVDTDDGNVRVEELKGDLKIRTGDGAVDARQIEGAARIDTADGNIRADGVFRGLYLETRDGAIDSTVRSGSAVESDWSATTGDGNVRLELPEGLNAELDAQTSDGRVQLDRVGGPARDAGESDERERLSFRGKLGSGGKALKVRSGSGSITVKLW